MDNPVLIDAPWTDDRTLDELESDDKQQLERCWHKAKAYHFAKGNQAKAFMGESVRAVLARMGIDLRQNREGDALDREMKERRVKIEHRIDYPAHESWRRGLYIYKDDELAVFISHPIVNSPRLNKSAPGRVIVPDTIAKFVIWTNAWDVADRLYQQAAH